MGISLLFVGLTTFWIGRQNNDICRNEFKIERDINMHLQKYNETWRILESNSRGDMWTLEECHSTSLLLMEIGSLIMFISGLALGRYT